MKRFAYLPVIAVAFAAACQDAPSAVQTPVGPGSAAAAAGTGTIQTTLAASNAAVASATGQGSVIGREGARRIFKFAAFRYADGSADGSGMYETAKPGGLHLRLAIDCLVVEGNVARMSGTVDKVIRPGLANYPVGTRFHFEVVDNGEGNSASPDLMTRFANGAPGGDYPPPCTVGINWLFVPIVTGNIQVRSE